ncbi:MAG TPA: hypothetical protein VND64_29250 [Pirellulales bacterium]|nr:hypothetical protein [Pirellulales bacterium]
MSSMLCLLLAVLPASRPSAAQAAKSPQYAAGGIVVVTRDAAPLMDGNRTVTTVKRGCRLQITEVRDSWLKTKVYRGDKPHLAWIINSNVRPYDVALDLANRVETGDAHFKARLDALGSSSDRKVRSAVKVAWINSWRESLLKVLDSKDDESLLTPEAFTILLPSVDTLFRADDTLKRTAVSVLHTRTRQLSKADLDAWRPVLEQASGEPVLNSQVALMLIQQDDLFHRGKFDRELSDRWIERLKLLPMPEVLAWSERTHSPPHRAAVALAQADSLFNDNQFQSSAFEDHLRNHRLVSSR